MVKGHHGIAHVDVRHTVCALVFVVNHYFVIGVKMLNIQFLAS